MARMVPTSTSKHRPIIIMTSSPAILHAAWITVVVGVCLALCTMHSRKPSSSSSCRRRGSRSASSNHRCGSNHLYSVSVPSRETNGAGSVGTAATTPAKVSPTPSDTAMARGADVGGPVTVIDVGTHGPIPPAFLPPDPFPPRRSLSSAKHTRFAERVGRIRSMRRGGSGEGAAAEDDVFVGCHRGGEVGEEGTLWTKTIILGERCRVPSGSDEDDGVDGVTVKKWKSYRPRQPRSVPVTRSNSFAGAFRPTNP